MKDSFYSHIIHVFRTLRALGGGGGTRIVKTRSHIFLQVRALHNIFDSLNIKESLFFFFFTRNLTCTGFPDLSLGAGWGQWESLELFLFHKFFRIREEPFGEHVATERGVGDSDLRSTACPEVKNQKMLIDKGRAARGWRQPDKHGAYCPRRLQLLQNLWNFLLGATRAVCLETEIHTSGMPLQSHLGNRSWHGPSLHPKPYVPAFLTKAASQL